MKKTTNKGFSLVELIIVIAIMAILAGAIAPALIRYIDKSRRSNDISSAKTIKTAVEAAMTNEDTCALLTSGTSGVALTDLDGRAYVYYGSIEITPNTPTNGAGNGITISYQSSYTPGTNDVADAQTEIGNTLGDATPKLKYKKAADGTNTPDRWKVYCTQNGSVISGVSDSSNHFYQLAPEPSKYYE